MTACCDYTGRESPASAHSAGPSPYSTGIPGGMPPPPRTQTPPQQNRTAPPSFGGPPPFPGAYGGPQGGPQGGPPQFGGPPPSNGGMPNGMPPPPRLAGVAQMGLAPSMSAPATPKFLQNKPSGSGPSTTPAFHRLSMTPPQSSVQATRSMGAIGGGSQRFQVCHL